MNMIGYKGLDKNFCCCGFQYEVGKTYQFNGEIKICERGFHFCNEPLAVFEYYSPAESRFALVEATEPFDNEGHNFCTSQITILKELTLEQLLQRAKEMATSNSGFRSAATNSGDFSVATNSGFRSAATNSGFRSAATNSGFRSAATNSGDFSTATNSGFRSAATNSGDFSTATNSGNFSAATNSGDFSVATNSGNFSAATNSGDFSVATSTGDFSVATNSGNFSAATSTGKKSIALALGKDSKAKGALGCWLVLSEWCGKELLDVKMVKVDGQAIKPDTFYTLKNDEVVEWEKN